ncbi:hypothetical protein HDV06_007152 [Boothiomyces sp. JEL0866]|nr:hypothetical protein HDV06_007152 [Boothiomyces sp. JEL0866]
MFKCLYRKKQTKKHSTWDDDGYLKIGSNITLLDDDKQPLKSTSLKKIETEIINVGGLEVQVPLSEIQEYYASGKCSLSNEIMDQPAEKRSPLKPITKSKKLSFGSKKPLARKQELVAYSGMKEFKLIYKKKGSKNWENDGVLLVDGQQGTITSEKGVNLGSIDNPAMEEGQEFVVGSRVFQITEELNASTTKKVKTSRNEFKTPLIGYKKPASDPSNVVKPGSIVMTRPDSENVRDVILDQFIASTNH